MKNSQVVTGMYYGTPFKGQIEAVEPNWENGAFEKSEGVRLSITLDDEIEYTIGSNNPKTLRRENLSVIYVDGKTDYYWGTIQLIK